MGDQASATAETTTATAAQTTEARALTPEVQAIVDKKVADEIARVESYWQGEVKRRDDEMGKKANTHGEALRKVQERLDAAEAAVEVAKLGDDAMALARSRAQLQRAQRDFEEREQGLAQRAAALSLQERAAGIFAPYPNLPQQFRDDAKRRLAQGTPDYVIEREARALADKTAAPTPASRASPVPPTNLGSGGGEAVTADNIDKLYLAGKVPDDKYRAFLQSGKL